jgi:hypothetical protein
MRRRESKVLELLGLPQKKEVLEVYKDTFNMNNAIEYELKDGYRLLVGHVDALSEDDL